MEPRGPGSPEPEPRSGRQESWYVGLALGAIGGFLSLEFPLLGLGIGAATVVILLLKGRAGAGIGGLLVGAGGTWLALFGRVALDCRVESGCTAPNIGSAVAFSAGLLAVGAVLSIVVVARTRRR